MMVFDRGNRLRVLCPLGIPLIACTLAWWLSWPQAVDSHGTLTTTVLFDREIVRILNTRCVMCHDDRALSFPLVTYEQTWVRRNAVRAAILGRHMPPWPAVAGYGQFANANSLTMREKQFVVGWVEGLGPRNAGQVFLNVSDARAARTEEVRAASHAGHWQLGEPDLARSLEARTIAARRAAPEDTKERRQAVPGDTEERRQAVPGDTEERRQAVPGDRVSRTVIDLGLTSEQRVRAIEYLPGDRRVVRAAVFTLEQTGQWLGSWTPWYGFVTLPAGVAYRLPAGSRIVADIHYRSIAEPVVDRGTLGFFFAGRSATRVASDLTLDARAVPSPPGARVVRAMTRLNADTSVWAMRPEFGPGVRTIEVSARRADGSTEVLLLARDPSTEWPTPFILEQPRLLRRGTQLSLVAHYHGDAAAPAPVRVTFSRSTPP